MASHTPGPWAVEDVNSEHMHDIILDYQVPNAGFPNLVASVYFDEDNDGPISMHEASANARLIAASPDLLAACKLWDQGFVDGEDFTEAQFVKWVNDNRRAARAAIAKATDPLTPPAA